MKLMAAFLAFITVLPLPADEGMWPYNQFPKDAIKAKRGFDVSDDFLERLRLSAVRIGAASGSFVSPNGLLLTNQHVVASCLSSAARKDGFYAAAQTAETRCPGFEASILLSTEDVSAQIKTSQAVAQRNASIAKIEHDCAVKSGNVCSVVKLFSGGRYDLYQYKKYTDLRVVFVPENALAFFGRERDSITYLRYGLDIAFLRAYDSGKPAATPHYLKWSTEGVKEGDLIFAAGNPGVTTRSTTAAQLTFYRDKALPLTLSRLQPRIVQLNALVASQPAIQPAVEAVLTAFLETYKSTAGKLIGLRDDRLVLRKMLFDKKIRNAVERDPKLGTEGGKVWDELAAAYKTWTPLEKTYQILDGSPAPGSRLYRIARQLAEGQELSADVREPINETVEIMLLTQYLEEVKGLGDKEVPLKSILAGKTPQQAAEAAVKSSKLSDPVEQRRLAANHDALSKSDDGMIRLALALQGPARKIRKKHDEVIGALETSSVEKIAQYRFRLFGAADYPDGTFSPRVEFGLVKGYMDRAEVAAPFAASFGGLFYRRSNEGPYQVPQRWIDARASLDLVTPLDFVSTCDIGGGDAGSPTVNRAGELVGVTFDGNLESLPNTYLYQEDKARAVHVAAHGIVESLQKVYKAAALLQELGANSRPGVT